MKPEDYPLVEFEGRRLRRCPEPPSESPRKQGGDCCVTCVAMPTHEQYDRDLCARISQRVYEACSMVDQAGKCLHAVGCVFVPEDRFQEYVVELVRRRVSS